MSELAVADRKSKDGFAAYFSDYKVEICGRSRGNDFSILILVNGEFKVECAAISAEPIRITPERDETFLKIFKPIDYAEVFPLLNHVFEKSHQNATLYDFSRRVAEKTEKYKQTAILFKNIMYDMPMHLRTVRRG